MIRNRETWTPASEFTGERGPAADVRPQLLQANQLPVAPSSDQIMTQPYLLISSSLATFLAKAANGGEKLQALLS